MLAWGHVTFSHWTGWMGLLIGHRRQLAERFTSSCKKTFFTVLASHHRRGSRMSQSQTTPRHVGGQGGHRNEWPQFNSALPLCGPVVIMMSWPAAAVISRHTATGKKGWVMPHVCPFRPLMVGAPQLFAWDSIWLTSLVWTLVAPSCFSDVTPGTLPWWKVALTLCSGIYRFTHCPKTEGLPPEVRNSDLKKSLKCYGTWMFPAQNPLQRLSVNTFVCTGFAIYFSSGLRPSHEATDWGKTPNTQERLSSGASNRVCPSALSQIWMDPLKLMWTDEVLTGQFNHTTCKATGSMTSQNSNDYKTRRAMRISIFTKSFIYKLSSNQPWQ